MRLTVCIHFLWETWAYPSYMLNWDHGRANIILIYKHLHVGFFVVILLCHFNNRLADGPLHSLDFVPLINVVQELFCIILHSINSLKLSLCCVILRCCLSSGHIRSTDGGTRTYSLINKTSGRARFCHRRSASFPQQSSLHLKAWNSRNKHSQQPIYVNPRL